MDQLLLCLASIQSMDENELITILSTDVWHEQPGLNSLLSPDIAASCALRLTQKDGTASFHLPLLTLRKRDLTRLLSEYGQSDQLLDSMAKDKALTSSRAIASEWFVEDICNLFHQDLFEFWL